jgi:hypothetical protein
MISLHSLYLCKLRKALWKIVITSSGQRNSQLCPADRDWKHLWNTGQFLTDYTVQHPRIQASSQLSFAAAVRKEYGTTY